VNWLASTRTGGFDAGATTAAPTRTRDGSPRRPRSRTPWNASDRLDGCWSWCGTGVWTRQLVGHADTVTAVDASPEVIEMARARVDDPRVSYVCADLFAWEPPASYDVCFFGFWLSHVPEPQWRPFWAKVRRCLRPGGRVFFVDNLPSDLSAAVDDRLPDGGDETMTRRLADGREFRIVKRFYEPHALRQRLADLGWDVQVQTTPEFFMYGQATTASERVEADCR